MMHADADWRSQGACLSADPELFFPLSSAGPSVEQLNEAKMVCARCLVKTQCLDFALATRQVHGVWGGTSEEERRPLLAHPGRARPAVPRRVHAPAGRPR